MKLFLPLVVLLALAVASYFLFLSWRLRKVIKSFSPWETLPRYPPVLVVVPVKGVLAGLRESITAILAQGYPCYEVVLVTESEEDPANPILQSVCKEASCPTRLIYAGRPTQCGGKVHNLLAGLSARGSHAEVYLFLDADAKPEPSFLVRLVGVLLGQAKGGIATGYRWVSPPNGSISSLISVAFNAIALHFLPDPRFSMAWGGATAIEKKTFEELGVREVWERAVSDDVALSMLARASNRPIVFAPGALLLDSQSRSLRQFWAWGMRQITILRACTPREWVLSLVTQLALLAFYIFGVSFALATNQPAFLLALLPLVAQLVQGVMFVSDGRILCQKLSDRRFLLSTRLIFFFPLVYWWISAQEVMATFRRTIVWSGLRYRLDGPYRGTLLGSVAPK